MDKLHLILFLGTEWGLEEPKWIMNDKNKIKNEKESYVF